MTTSEPTTGEIVRLLRMCATTCEGDCYYYDNRDACAAVLKKDAADRLESQEKTIATMRGDNFDATSVTNVLAYLDTVMGLIHCADGIKDLIVSMQGTAIELTARAEQAEAERDAAIKFIRTSDWCAGCENMKNLHCDFMKECANPHDLYKLRGLPQEGEGK